MTTTTPTTPTTTTTTTTTDAVAGSALAVRFALVVLAGALLAVACIVPPIDLGDRSCDDEHPCVEGYFCAEGTCEREDGASG
jgi:hypothetical protein